MSEAAAYQVQEAALIPPAVLGVTVAAAYRAVTALFKPGVSYSIKIDDSDGMVLKRFSRTLPLEAWLVARAVDEDGAPLRNSLAIVCPMAFSLAVVGPDKDAFGAALVAELEALKAAA